jgi:PAS domain S-box-containing protein
MLHWPARWMVPLFIALLALLALGFRYVDQGRGVERDVSQEQASLLRERLSLEQSRLDPVDGDANPLLVRRLVSSLALYDNLSLAYLVDANGQIEAALSRQEIGQPLSAALALQAARVPEAARLNTHTAEAAVRVVRPGGTTVLTGVAPLKDGRTLRVLADLEPSLALRQITIRSEALREGTFLLAGVVLLTAFLHLFWFRRAKRLMEALSRMGDGDLAVRTGLSGHDELGRIGLAADRMASDLQAEQTQLRYVYGLVNRSPVVVIEWRNAPGWPVSYASESVQQWGYSREELLRGELQYNDLFHPDDAGRVNAEIAGYFANGPDDYRQEYRICCADGRWAWVDDRTSLTRGASGEVLRISGVLLDVTEQKTAQIAQREQAELLRLFFELPFTGMAITSPENKRWLQVNDRLCQILGYPRDVLLNKTWSEITHPDDLQTNLRLFNQLLAGETGCYQMNKRFLRADGTVVYTAMDVRAVHNADGSLKHLFTTIHDVTERLQAEQALQDKERLLAEAQRVARLGNWNLQLQSGVALWSDEEYRLLGYEPGAVEPTLDHFMQAVHPEDRDRVQSAMQRAMSAAGDHEYHVEHRVLNGGGIRHLEQRGRVDFDDQERPVRMFGTTMDITERVEVARMVRDYKDMLEQAEALVKLGSWSVDTETQRLTISSQLFRNMGLEPADEPPSDEAYIARIHPDDRAAVIEDMQRIRGGLPVGELLFRTNPAHGPIRWMRRTVQRATSLPPDDTPRYIGTLLDITESVETEVLLRSLNEELESRVAKRTRELEVANRELEAFSYSVSHDLKAPLRGIDGYSQLLEDEYGARLDEDGRLFVQRVRQGVKQMGELINDLLEYSRMERRDMTQDPVALVPLIDGVLQNYRADIERLGAEVALDVPPLTLPLDREGIAVVLRNLIGNALKFSAEARPPRLEIGARVEPQRRILWVRDNGVGFDMKYHDRIFGIFQRLHRAEAFPGTGVGLALVAKAVQRMGGRVWAESEPGAGATFFLEFPE